MESLKLTLVTLIFLSFSGCGNVTTEEEGNRDLNTTTIIDNNESLETDVNDTLPISTPIVTLNKTINLDNFINDVNCDQVLEKEFSTGSLLSICYDYGYKSALYVAYTLDGELVNKLPSIEERPRFYTETEIPKEYQVLYSDYTHSGYDRGHLAPDADFDYNEEDLDLIYTLANIIPQDPNVNRYFWTKAEYQERLVAASLGELNVINGVVFDKNPSYIGEHQIAVSKAFWKILYNDEKEFRQCYYYNNYVLEDADLDTLDKHRVDCDRLIIEDES